MKISLAKKFFICLTSVLIAVAAAGNQDIPAAEASRFNQELPTAGTVERRETTALVPLGTVFGIKLYTDGVIVTKLTSVETEDGAVCPAAVAGIRTGDYITAVNGKAVSDNEAFLDAMAEVSEYPVNITIRRDGRETNAEITPVPDGDFMRCGMWIRDSAAGIGTLTYYDPRDGSFGGLGHGICDVDTKTVMDLRFGEPAGICITDVVRAGDREPGKICGYFDGDDAMGELRDNRDTGIYGKLAYVPEGDAIPTAAGDQVRTGRAEIISTLDDSGPRAYGINIDRICSRERRTKNFIIRVTDSELLEKTGGIVQGMSGSPIIQDGKLIGAVTHVLLNDPSRGYGIFIENMLDAAD